MFAVRCISLILILISKDEMKQKFKGKINIQKITSDNIYYVKFIKGNRTQNQPKYLTWFCMSSHSPFYLTYYTGR